MSDANELLRNEFNQWAADGRGEEMERHHISIAEQTFDRMNFKAGDRVLDLGCGAGWATRRLAQAIRDAGADVKGGEGQAVGLDISDEMIARARELNSGVDNALFVVAAATEIPWQDSYFSKVLSIESFYYYPHQEAVLIELHRVTEPGGELFILINLYKENHYSLRWVGELKVPVHARSEQEYLDMISAAGFRNVRAERIPDLTPTPDTYSGKWFANADELKDFKRIGALLLRATR